MQRVLDLCSRMQHSNELCVALSVKYLRLRP
eukprot:COSAG04_NODE_22522_length_353_cov_1.173228_2_plen_30_part_01